MDVGEGREQERKLYSTSCIHVVVWQRIEIAVADSSCTTSFLLIHLVTRPGRLPGSAIRNQDHLHPVIGGGNAIPFKGSYVLVSWWIGHIRATVKVRNKVNAYTAVV